ncbi:DNA polymerase/3'-5' exonuclease PolX, partial [Candidatus Woesearchaeota archaeon]|nr:DNA polymerase/3'-5' exonuclease PolX [Candidatus Woesearchaeota archaeon]
VAQLLYDIADLLEMQGVQFKPAAYRKAARSVETLSGDVEELYGKGGIDALMELPGVGESIAGKIVEFLRKGKLKYYDDLKRQFPGHISELMNIPGLGPKKIKVLNEKLKISTVDELEAAAKAHKISKVRGFGEKSEGELLRNISTFRLGRQRMLLGYALPVALEIESRLKALNGVIQASLAGSLRRRKETIGDIDLLVSCRGSAAARGIMRFFTAMPEVSRALAKGETKSSILLKTGLQVDLRVVEDDIFGAALQYFTGSKEHNVAVRGLAIRKGLKLSEYGVFRKGGRRIAGKTEEEVYGAIGLPYIEPEIRENSGEVEVAIKGKLPKLIQYGSIRGDFHAHTVKSDGGNKLEEMVAAAKKLSYEYIAITDHSKSERIAHGLSDSEMESWLKEIRAAGAKEKGIRILAGSEVDILANGDLDYPDELLSSMDIVIGSIHSRFKSSRRDMTERILAAIENEHLDILAHPTGRKIGQREPYDADFDRIFKAAAENDVLLEINSYPDRSDLSDVLARKAKTFGCKFVIDTDSHSIGNLKFMELGVSIARRAWLSSEDIVNTKPLRELPRFFRKLRI